MENKEFAKYHTWCDEKGIRVYPIPTGNNGQFNIAVERQGKASIGKQVFYDKPESNKQTSVWEQIGVLLKMIVYKELELMEIKSTFNQLEGICAAAFKKDKAEIMRWLSVKVPFREAVLYLEGFYPDKKECAALIYKLAHCKCGLPAVKWNKTTPTCALCSFEKSKSKIEYSNEVKPIKF